MKKRDFYLTQLLVQTISRFFTYDLNRLKIIFQAQPSKEILTIDATQENLPHALVDLPVCARSRAIVVVLN